jgi:hypothetical protein
MRNVQESGQVQRPLQNCGFSDGRASYHQSGAQSLEMAPGFFGKFVDRCPERFHDTVLLVRGHFSYSNLAQLMLNPRTLPIDEVRHAWILFLRLVSTFMVRHFAYGYSLERRRKFDAPYSGRKCVSVGLLTLNILNVSKLKTNTRCSLVSLPSRFELERSNTIQKP